MRKSIRLLRVMALSSIHSVVCELLFANQKEQVKEKKGMPAKKVPGKQKNGPSCRMKSMKTVTQRERNALTMQTCRRCSTQTDRQVYTRMAEKSQPNGFEHRQ